MTRRLLIALCLLAVPLAAAPSADAAKRKVPRGFFGTIFDGDVRSAAATLVDQEFGLMATSGVESVRTNFFWAEVQPARAPPRSPAPTRSCARPRCTGSCCCPW